MFHLAFLLDQFDSTGFRLHALRHNVIREFPTFVAGVSPSSLRYVTGKSESRLVGKGAGKGLIFFDFTGLSLWF